MISPGEGLRDRLTERGWVMLWLPSEATAIIWKPQTEVLTIVRSEEQLLRVTEAE